MEERISTCGKCDSIIGRKLVHFGALPTRIDGIPKRTQQCKIEKNTKCAGAIFLAYALKPLTTSDLTRLEAAFRGSAQLLDGASPLDFTLMAYVCVDLHTIAEESARAKLAWGAPLDFEKLAANGSRNVSATTTTAKVALSIDELRTGVLTRLGRTPLGVNEIPRYALHYADSIVAVMRDVDATARANGLSAPLDALDALYASGKALEKELGGGFFSSGRSLPLTA